MRAIATVALAICLIVAAGAGAALALFTEPVFAWLDFHPVALDYMDGRLTRLELEQEVILGQTFGATEIDHLEDVAALLGVLGWMFVAALAAVIMAALVAPQRLRSAANYGLIGLAAVGLLVVGAYLVFGFATVGALFHEIVFPQGNWRFPWHTLIIRLYGTDVMVRGAAFVIATGLGLLAAVFVATRFIARPAPPDVSGDS